MSDNHLYTFDRQSMRRISAAVQKSEGVKDRKGNGWYPIRAQSGDSVSYKNTLRIGKTTKEWDVGNDATLVEWERKADGSMGEKRGDNGLLIEFDAYNLFANVSSDKFVACQNGYLISAECD